MTCSTVRKKSVNTGVTHEMEHAGPKTHANRHTHSQFMISPLPQMRELYIQSLYLKANCYQLFWNWHTTAIVHSQPSYTGGPQKEKHSFDRRGKVWFCQLFFMHLFSSLPFFFLLHNGKVGQKCNELQAEERLTGLAAVMVVVVLMGSVIGTPRLQAPNS